MGWFNQGTCQAACLRGDSLCAFMNSGKGANLALIIFYLISYLNTELFSWLSSPSRSHLYTLDLFILCKRLSLVWTEVSQLSLACSYITSLLGRQNAQGYLFPRFSI